MWVYVAQALGYSVSCVRTPHQDFLRAMQHLFPQLDIRNDEADIPLTSCPRRGDDCNAWFTDLETIKAAPQEHWERRRLPHVFTLPADEAPPIPVRWSLEVQDFRHSELGGSTMGSYRLGLLVPAENYNSQSSAPPLPRQPWASIATVINDVEFAEPPTPEVLTSYLAADPNTRQGPTVIKIGGVVDSRGLASREMTNVPVILGCVFNPSKVGIRSLTLFEMGALRDVPILFLDHLRLRGGVQGRALLKLLIEGHPSKVLFLGGDYLLTAYVRGGGAMACGAMASPRAESSGTDVLSRWIDLERSGFEEVPEDTFVEQEVAKMESERSEWNKDDDSPIHFYIWDEMFLRSWRDTQGGRSVGDGWNKPSDPVIILPCKDPRECALSDAQLKVKMTLPRWRWALMKMRAGLLRYWRRKMTRDLLAYLRKELGQRSERPSCWVHALRKRKKVPGQNRTVLYYVWTKEGRDNYCKSWQRARAVRGRDDVESTWQVGSDCIRRTANSLWWDWAEGSALLFWRWPTSHVKWAREGQPHFLSGPLPSFKRPQRAAPTPEMMTQMKKKVNKVRKRRYIEEGRVVSLTHMFAVPKGLADIRMVYNGTSSGLNAVLFAPHFGLPTLFNTIRALVGGYYQCDLDVAEMFLCFNLHPDMRPYAGVDVRLIKTGKQEPWEVNRTRSYERWSRNFMGMRDSPYRSMQMMLMAKYLAYGDRFDPSNPFRWERVILNLPGSKGYNPSLPWVMKVRSDGHLACEIFVYVDDGRITGWSKLECWRAAQRLSSVLTSLGIQDAYRKRTPPTRGPECAYP